MFRRFWSDNFWLPANITWEDVTNGPDKTIVYAEAKDYWALIPLAILGLTLRFLSESYIFHPLGRYLKISDFKEKASPNEKLEAAYQESSTSINVSSLAKQLDLSERQIERWWRLRRRQDKPTTLVKFSESMWRGTHFTLNMSLGLYAVWGQEWVRDVELCLEGYPHQGLTPGILQFYMITSSFYCTSIISQFRNVRRKAFWQAFIQHDFATLALLYFSWVCQCFRIGCLTIILHDMVDILLEFGKAAKYAKFQKTLDCLFVLFVCVWVMTRLVLIPFYVLPSAFARLYWSPMIFVMNTLLVLLFALSLFWTWLIFKILLRTIYAGHLSIDIGSSGSEESEASTSSHGASKRVPRNAETAKKASRKKD